VVLEIIGKQIEIIETEIGMGIEKEAVKETGTEIETLIGTESAKETVVLTRAQIEEEVEEGETLTLTATAVEEIALKD
jgi:hypothetical protein